jgi:hypothetical protein
MAPPTVNAPGQADLLAWSPPEPVARFERERVRAVSLGVKMKRAIAEALRHQAELGFDRESIAQLMGDFLGEEVPKSALDAWASEAREEHMPSLVRFIALAHATNDRRLLQVMADMVNWAVVERRWLPMIELASIREHEDKVRERRKALQTHARIAGTL